MKNQIILGIAAIVLTLVAAKSFSPVLAYRGDPTVKGPNYTEERHQANINAFQKSDYNGWVKNMAGRGATRFVNKDNFAEFAKAQLQAQKGDLSLLNAFRTKYGMGQHQGQGNGRGMRWNQ